MGGEVISIISVIVAILLFAIERPLAFSITCVVIILVFCISTVVNKSSGNLSGTLNGTSQKRLAALDVAKSFLAPYTNIWQNLRLSNKFCTLKLGYDGKTITCNDKGSDRRFRIVNSKVHEITDLWDMFCLNYSYNTTYDGLVDDCRLFQAEIIQEGVSVPVSSAKDTTYKPSAPKEKVDVNNASEIELTALPGINIIMAKKIIKKREEIKGFKNVNEFFIYIKVKPHMESRLRELVCANKMKGSLKIERFSERKVDL